MSCIGCCLWIIQQARLMWCTRWRVRLMKWLCNTKWWLSIPVIASGPVECNPSSIKRLKELCVLKQNCMQFLTRETSLVQMRSTEIYLGDATLQICKGSSRGGAYVRCIVNRAYVSKKLVISTFAHDILHCLLGAASIIASNIVLQLVFLNSLLCK